MVFNSVLVATVATVSGDVWQSLACFTERITTEELLDLVIVLPFQQLGRFALVIWNCFCVPLSPMDSYVYYSYYDSDSDSDSYTTSIGGGGMLNHDRNQLHSYSDSYSD